MTTYTHINLFIDVLDNKKFRELICETYIEENPKLSQHLVEFWNLKRINHKYITKTRLYNENSYSKRKIQDEEIIFCRKTAIFQPLHYYFCEQQLINRRLLEDFKQFELNQVDDQFYFDTVISSHKRFDFPMVPIGIKKNNRFRLQLTSEIVEIAPIREKVINEYFRAYPDLSDFIYTNFKLNFIKYKYIDKTITPFESSYTRQKIKNQESFFIHKFFQYSIWLRRLVIFDDLYEKTITEYLTEHESKTLHENRQFLEVLVKDSIMNFRDFDFDDFDINLS
ncbi:hypothetical protein RZE82_03120 [Mollicutes bacterium LVI A0039]|nr:hypothetical protein RZE82_03120 [Mollicutes bacterium LVI A0039]